MRKRATLLLAFAVAAVAAPIGAQAHDNASACTAVVQKVQAGGQTLYIDDRRPDHGQFKDVPTSGYWGGGITGLEPEPFGHTGNGVWFYLESNGVSGLQRGGYAEAFNLALGEEDGEYYAGEVGSKDTCQASSNPDTIIF